jgi:toxin secretion/phage lysis holin
MNTVLELFKMGDYQKFLMTLGAMLGASFSFIVGGIDTPITWLIVLCITDYITGMIAAFKTGKWCSNTGFKGIAKKVIMFLIIGLCVAIDTTTKTDMLRDIAIFSYSLNEAGSILENIDRMGFSKYIPSFIKNGIEQLKNKENDKNA